MKRIFILSLLTALTACAAPTRTFEFKLTKGATQLRISGDPSAVLVQALKALRVKMDVHAHNLANAHTTAYKRSRVNFADLVYQQYGRVEKGIVGIDQIPTPTEFGRGVRLVSTSKIFDQGVLDRTTRDLDLALDGEGFFRIRLPDDTVAYTRAGSFNMDSDGNIVTTEGYLLDPPITIADENIIRLLIDQTGLIQGFDPSNPDNLQQIDQLSTFRFKNPSGLESIGDNLFRRTPAAGEEIQGTPATSIGFGRIRQGYLEDSNVFVEQEEMELRRTLKLYRTLRDLLKQIDD